MKKQTKRFLAKIMTIVMLCSLITFPVNATPEPVEVTKSATATSTEVENRQGKVELKVKGNITNETQPVDVVLVLDTSGSMGSKYNNAIVDLKSAAERFSADVLKTEGSRVAVVSYSESAATNIGFSSDKDQIKMAINSLNANGATNMHAGLLLAYDLVASSTATNKAVVFMSDGAPNRYLYRVISGTHNNDYQYDYRVGNDSAGLSKLEYGRGEWKQKSGKWSIKWSWQDKDYGYWGSDWWGNPAWISFNIKGPGSGYDSDSYSAAFDVANQIKSKASIYTIKLQGQGDSSAVDALKAIASTGGYYVASDETKLQEMFDKISQKVTLVGKNAVIVDTVPEYFRIVSGSFMLNNEQVTENPLNVDSGVWVAGNVITWKLGNITKSEDVLTYKVEAYTPYDDSVVKNVKSGRLDTNVSAVLTYNDAATNVLTTKDFGFSPDIYVKPFAYNFTFPATAGEPKTISNADFALAIERNEQLNHSGGANTLTPLDFEAVDKTNLHGTLEKKDSGFVYTANEDFTGQASFTYRVISQGSFGVINTDLKSEIKTVTFNVAAPTKYALTVTAPENSYTLSSNPAQAGSPYKLNTVVTAVAKDIEHKVFQGWSGDVDADYTAKSKTVTVTMIKDKAITATYTPEQVTLKVTAVGGTVDRNPNNTGGIYDYGTTVGLTATPNEGYEFKGWSGGGLSGDSLTTSIEMNGNKEVTAQFEKKDVTLNLSATGGTLESSDGKTTYKYGDVVELIATADEHYHFVNFSGDPVTVADKKITIIMNGNKSVYALFAPDAFALNYDIIGGGTGIITVTSDKPLVNNKYEYGTVVTLTAADQANVSQFQEWVGADKATSIGSTKEIQVTITADTTVHAVVKPLHSLTVITDGNGSGTVNLGGATFDGEEKFVEGTTVTLTAVPAETSEFVGWNGGTDTGSLQVTMDKAKEVKATFRLKTYDLTLGADGPGTIDKKSGTYNHGASVTITATKGEHGVFVGWYEGTYNADKTIITYGSEPVADKDNNPYTITITGNKILQAKFVPTQHTITTGTTGVGTGKVTTGGTYDYGTKVKLTATADPGSRFISWTVTNESTKEQASFTTEEIEVVADVNRTAVAEFVSTYDLTVLVTGNGDKADSVTTTSDKPAVNGRYDHGTIVTLTANEADGWDFVGWDTNNDGTVDQRGNNTLAVTMDASKTVRAEFQLEQYTLTLNPIKKEWGSILVGKAPNEKGKYINGEVVQLQADPKPGYHFDSWDGIDANSAKETDGIHSAAVTMTGDKTVTAQFAINTYTLTTAKVGEGSLTETLKLGSQTEEMYDHGSVVTLTATPALGWHFARWTGDVQSNEATIDVTMTANISITAVFEKTTFGITVNKVGQGTVTINPETPENGYDWGTQVSLTAQPASGWQFAGWSGDVSNANQSISVTMDSTKILTATFTEIPAPPVTPPSGPTIERDKADPPSTNIPEERAPQGLPAVPAVKPEPVVALPEEVIPLGVPVLPKTGETSSMFFYLLGLGLVGAGVLSLRRKETN